MIHFNAKTLLVAMAASVAAHAVTPVDATHSSRDISENLNASNKERFMYNKGFKDGYEIGKREGYKKALDEAKKALDEYKNTIHAYEMGKYLARKGKITPPRLYQKRGRNGQFSVIVKGCEVRGELSPADILKLPKYIGKETVSASSFSDQGVGESSKFSDGVFLTGIDHRHTPIAKPTTSLKQVNAIILRDTKFYRDLLRSSGTLFSIEENGGGLKAVFSSPRERDSFIRNYGLEYGKDYK